MPITDKISETLSHITAHKPQSTAADPQQEHDDTQQQPAAGKKHAHAPVNVAIGEMERAMGFGDPESLSESSSSSSSQPGRDKPGK
jgi:hypothetical protein